MNTLNRTLECAVVGALEEQIWLDRREDACTFSPARPAGLAGLKVRFRDFAARMQLGPVSDGETWLDRHREDRF